VNRARSHPVRVGLKLSQGAPIETFREVWRIADGAGFDHCWAFDHLVSLDSSGQPRPLFEGWSLVAAMAVATTQVRIGLLVGGMTYRHPALLAKIAVTADHLSGGRLEFGIGAGWAERERSMLGIDDSHAVGRFREGLDVLELLWSGERVNYEGRYFNLRDAVVSPPPLQKPRPPLWIGAGGPQMLRLTAKRADVWNPSGESFEDALKAADELERFCEVVGRDPASIRWSTQVSFDGRDAFAVVDELDRWCDVGFSELIVYCSGADPVAAADVAGEKILPALRDHSR
jgi:alkanesulfonate monooxygenase SsuD/methylene tetrahydromethanopterin reductase-like flavin-dependent oxidoreductase (luciferase family)